MTDSWRTRLRQALEASGKSMRQASLESGCAANYFFEVIEGGKEPGVGRLVRMADVLGVSMTWLFLGVELGAQEEELLRLYAMLPDAQRRAILDLAGLADRQQDE
jgi:transcriptional regulator with XRE-family HTH domain